MSTHLNQTWRCWNLQSDVEPSKSAQTGVGRPLAPCRSMNLPRPLLRPVWQLTSIQQRTTQDTTAPTQDRRVYSYIVAMCTGPHYVSKLLGHESEAQKTAYLPPTKNFSHLSHSVLSNLSLSLRVRDMHSRSSKHGQVWILNCRLIGAHLRWLVIISPFASFNKLGHTIFRKHQSTNTTQQVGQPQLSPQGVEQTAFNWTISTWYLHPKDRRLIPSLPPQTTSLPPYTSHRDVQV